MKAAASSGLRPQVGLRALLVEDDPTARALYADMLRSDGFLVTEAATLADAAHRIVERPAVLVLDRRLPDGDGLDLARAVRATRGATVIVVVSADERPTARRDALAAGCDGFVAKTSARFLLVDAIRRALAARAGASAAPDAPTVLVVDDSDDNRLLYASNIAEAGYRVEEAKDGAEALERVRARRPTVIVMDLSMPVLDGWQTTRRLKSDPKTSGILIIAITAHTTMLGLRQATDAGADAVLTKPCLPRDLIGVIESLMPDEEPAAVG
ncbi:MAG: response regulator [Labilithrix sp.]|nr:response regulator [Labilithrix sp.]MCW5816790.1 response regulator [Labilithrix sp.]